MSLFHYTNVQAVQSILSTKKIRLTDIRYLNDSQELHDGFSILEKSLKNPQQGLFSNPKNKEKAIKYIKSMLFQGDTYSEDLEPIYIFSLSSTDDLLSQWRAYGTYAIEFDKSVLKEYVGSIKECVYDKKEKEGQATNGLTEAINIMSNEIATCNGCLGPLGTNALIKLVYDAAYFKHDGFSEEKEHRIIKQSEYTNNYNTTQYRTKDNLLIPYIEIEISLDCIKSIQVGPMKNQKLAYKSMTEFVSKIENKWQNESVNIEYYLPVNASAIPVIPPFITEVKSRG